MKEENLIFIVSQPRAGSTYLQNLLSNNNSVNTCSEPWILLNFANQIKPDLVTTKFDNETAHVAFIDYLKKVNIDFNTFRKDSILKLYEPLLKGFTHVIDKTPLYWEMLDEISVLFPKAKIIILKRNPIDVAISMIKTWHLNNLQDLELYKRDLLIAPKQIQKFCIQNASNPNVRVVKYEDLIENTEDEVKSIYNWLGLFYSPQILDTSNNIKFKGIYGDPFQNNTNYELEKTKVEKKNISKLFEEFLAGYYSYLGTDFLTSYGSYRDQNIPKKKTIVFRYYLYYLDSKYHRSILKEIYWRLKKMFYNYLIQNKKNKK